MTIGRAPGSTRAARRPRRLAAAGAHLGRTATTARWCSRTPARATAPGSTGSASNGPRPLRDGSRIRIGNQELVVERRRDEAEAGRTVVVRPGDSAASESGSFGTHPRVRSGYALKRLEASRGPGALGAQGPRVGPLPADVRRRRRSSSSCSTAGTRCAELVREAEQRVRRRRARRGWRGCCRSSPSAGCWRAWPVPTAPAERRPGSCSGSRPRGRRRGPARAKLFDRLYRRGGWRLFTRAGAGRASRVLAWRASSRSPIWWSARYGTPFVVAQKVGVGGARVPARALRRRGRARDGARADDGVLRPAGAQAGLKLLLIFPYAYVDTSEAWFEPRRRRIAISAAGPVSDLSLGRAVRARLPGASGRSDPGHPLPARVRRLRRGVLQPESVRRARRLPDPGRRAAGAGPAAACARAAAPAAERGGGAGDSRVLARYAVFGVAWSAVAACFAVGMSLRYEPRLAQVAPDAGRVGGAGRPLGGLLPAGDRGPGRAAARAEARPGGVR